MRTLLLLAVAATLGLASTVKADPPDGKRPSREDIRKKILDRFDKNKNGKIDDDEKAAIRAAFAKHRAQSARPQRGESDEHRGHSAHHKRGGDDKHRARGEHHGHGHHAHHGHKRPEAKKECPKKPSAKGCPKKESAKGCPKKESAKGCPKKESAKGCPKKESAKGCPKKGDAAKSGKCCPSGARKGSCPAPRKRSHVEEAKKKFLEKFDRNKNGKIDDDEKDAIRKAFQQRAREFVEKKTAQGADKIVDELDKNNDGKLNVDEVPEDHRKHFGEVDKNHDGYVDKGELKAAMDEARKKIISHVKERIEEHRKQRSKK